MMRSRKPPRLRSGDLIGLVSPASTPSPEKIQKASLYLEALGYRVTVGNHATASHGYLAGNDSERAADFNGMISDPRVKAIFATRGGYGTPRILPLIDYEALQRQPKIIAGFSDITALQLAVFHKTGLITFSGPMPAVEFCNSPSPYTEENFWRMLTVASPPGKLSNPSNQSLRWSGNRVAEGVLLGGNLSLVTSSLGTPFSPSFRDAILALEDIDEPVYRVDRMMTQLRNAGILSEVAGLLLGHFTGSEARLGGKPSLSLDNALNEIFTGLPIPIVRDLQYGHVPEKLTLPVGARTRIDPSEQTIEIIESPVCD